MTKSEPSYTKREGIRKEALTERFTASGFVGNKLWSAKDGTVEADQLEILAVLIERYEREHFPIPDPDPVDFLHHVMEARGLTRKDLEACIGSRARVAEVLNRVRPLSLKMIRKLSERFGIPAEVLIRRYELAA